MEIKLVEKDVKDLQMLRNIFRQIVKQVEKYMVKYKDLDITIFSFENHVCFVGSFLFLFVISKKDNKDGIPIYIAIESSFRQPVICSWEFDINYSETGHINYGPMPPVSMDGDELIYFVLERIGLISKNSNDQKL